MPNENLRAALLEAAYLEEISTFIQHIIGDEKSALALTAEVFQKYQSVVQFAPFKKESERSLWLHLRARELATAHLKAKHEAIKEKAIEAAIKDYPWADL